MRVKMAADLLVPAARVTPQNQPSQAEQRKRRRSRHTEVQVIDEHSAVSRVADDHRIEGLRRDQAREEANPAPREVIAACKDELPPAEQFEPHVAGILDGDYVVVRKAERVENGAVGVAYIDGDATVKRIFRTRTGYRLQPENKSFKPIDVDESTLDFRIGGSVVGVVRKL